MKTMKRIKRRMDLVRRERRLFVCSMNPFTRCYINISKSIGKASELLSELRFDFPNYTTKTQAKENLQ